MRDDIAILGVIWHLYGQGAIDEQHVAAIDEGDTHRFAQQQRPEPGAVDEESAIEISRLFRPPIGKITRLAPDHPRHAVDDMLDAEPLDAMIATERNEAPSVQMIGIIGDPGI